MPSSKTPIRGVHQRLTFPPPPPRPSLAALSDTKELGDELALALFMILRRVDCLAHGVEIRPWRIKMDEVAGEAPELAGPVEVLSEGEVLTKSDRRGMAQALQQIADWAFERGYPELAVQFAEGSVALFPNSGSLTYAAARTSRLAGRVDSAEVLYLRAITLGRAKRNWSVYVRAHLGLGLICKDAGQYDKAVAHYNAASNAAWKNSGERWLAGLTQHDLLGLMLATGDLPAAFEHATKAYAWLPKHNERIPALVHDYAFLLLQMNAYEVALPLVEAVVRTDIPPVDKVIGWSTLARTVGVLGFQRRFHDAQQEVTALAKRYDHHVSAAYANLAIGAHALGLMGEAESFAVQSIEIARARGEVSVLAVSDPLLASIRGGEQAQNPQRESPPAPYKRLARDLVALLDSWRGPMWKRKQQSGSKRLGEV